MDVVVNPPRKGEPSYASFIAQKEGTLQSLAERAKLVAETFNSIEGFTCQTVQGAMYAFPRVSIFGAGKKLWSNFDSIRNSQFRATCLFLFYSSICRKKQ